MTSDSLAVILLKKRITKDIVQPTECHANTWHAAPNPLALDPAAPPRLFSRNSMFQHPYIRCLRSVLSIPETCSARAHKQLTPTRCLVLVLMLTAPLLPALKAAQVPLHSPDIAVTCQHHQFISEKQVQARTWASYGSCFLVWVHITFYPPNSLKKTLWFVTIIASCTAH